MGLNTADETEAKPASASDMVATTQQAHAGLTFRASLVVFAKHKAFRNELIECCFIALAQQLELSVLSIVKFRKSLVRPEAGEVTHVELDITPARWQVEELKPEGVLKPAFDTLFAHQVSVFCLPWSCIMAAHVANGQAVLVLFTACVGFVGSVGMVSGKSQRRWLWCCHDGGG